MGLLFYIPEIRRVPYGAVFVAMTEPTKKMVIVGFGSYCSSSQLEKGLT